MYYSHFKSLRKPQQPRFGSWPADPARPAVRLRSGKGRDRAFDIADACLNSWNEAHVAYRQFQKGHAEPTFAAHQAFVNLCGRALMENGIYLSRWPLECVAFALLNVWIELEEYEQKLAGMI